MSLVGPTTLAFLAARAYVRFGPRREPLIVYPLMFGWFVAEYYAAGWVSSNSLFGDGGYIPSPMFAWIMLVVFSVGAFIFGVTEEKSNPPSPRSWLS